MWCCSSDCRLAVIQEGRSAVWVLLFFVIIVIIYDLLSIDTACDCTFYIFLQAWLSQSDRSWQDLWCGDGWEPWNGGNSKYPGCDTAPSLMMSDGRTLEACSSSCPVIHQELQPVTSNLSMMDQSCVPNCNLCTYTYYSKALKCIHIDISVFTKSPDAAENWF